MVAQLLVKNIVPNIDSLIGYIGSGSFVTTGNIIDSGASWNDSNGEIHKS